MNREPDSTIIREALWGEDQKALKSIRNVVFIQEQKVSEAEEWDELDESATHFLAFLSNDDSPVGTARLLPCGQIGRMAVLKKFRRKRIGATLLNYLLDYAETKNFQSVHLNAQIQAIPFYEQFGFIVDGKEFEDAGIPHKSMHRTLLKT